ncbi:hypothetical protein HYV86_00730 [Candidatus Woesearchaeota archaeon]|nr:hypothetical protein [Candidatus Woesearchaeota archaeon]
MDWSFLNNTWFVGITGGIISGVIVYFVTSYILSKKEDKLYLQKVQQANTEIIHILKPYIISEKRFSDNLFNSIISSVSKKYELESKDIINLQEAINDMVTDIMQTSFLTEAQKEVYTTKLLSLKQAPKQKENIVYLKKDEASTVSSRSFSFVLATTTVFMMTLVTIFVTLNDSTFGTFGSSTFFIVVSTLIPIVLTGLVIFIDLKKRLIRIKLKKDESEN